MQNRVYFDTTIFLDAFEGSPGQATLLEPIFEIAKRSTHRIVTSELTLAELLGKETGRGWTWQIRFYTDLILRGGFIDLFAVSREILLETGDHRRMARTAGRNVKLADAIHVVTAVKSSCQTVFTSDRRFFVPEPLTLVAADSAGVAQIKQMLDA